MPVCSSHNRFAAIFLAVVCADYFRQTATAGKPNQNAYIESFNGRLRDECLNEHWFPSLLHARTEIETWRREYNEERPKKALGGMTPSAYAEQLAMKAVPSPLDSKPDCY